MMRSPTRLQQPLGKMLLDMLFDGKVKTYNLTDPEAVQCVLPAPPPLLVLLITHTPLAPSRSLSLFRLQPCATARTSPLRSTLFCTLACVPVDGTMDIDSDDESGAAENVIDHEELEAQLSESPSFLVDLSQHLPVCKHACLNPCPCVPRLPLSHLSATICATFLFPLPVVSRFQHVNVQVGKSTKTSMQLLRRLLVTARSSVVAPLATAHALEVCKENKTIEEKDAVHMLNKKRMKVDEVQATLLVTTACLPAPPCLLPCSHFACCSWLLLAAPFC